MLNYLQKFIFRKDKAKSHKKTKGIIVVHMVGYPCNIVEIKIFAKNKISLLEDCAHALGTFFDGKHAVVMEYQVVFLFTQQNKSQQVREGSRNK